MIFFTLAIILNFMGLCACGGGDSSNEIIVLTAETQITNAAAATTKPAIETPITIVTKISETPAEPTDPEDHRSIILYQNTVAGLYCIYRIEEGGQTENTCFVQGNLIVNHGGGSLSAELIEDLFNLIDDNGFFQLESEYDIYPLDPDDTKVYEDIYYWLKVFQENRELHSVMAHEKAMPEPMVEITKLINDLASEISDQPLSGEYLLAGDIVMLTHKWGMSGYLLLELDRQELSNYPELQNAIDNPYSLLPVNTLSPQLKDLLNSGNNILEVMVEGKRYIIFLLRPLE